MKKKIVIIGKSCSGKTEFANILQNKGLRTAITCTTRPIRPIETDGVHYHFVSRDQFTNLMETDELVEWDEFNDWFYGLPKSEFEKSDILVVTPRGLLKIIEKFGRDSITVIYLDTSAELRMKRASLRGDKPDEVTRRYSTDEIDFEQYIDSEDWDVRIDQRMEDKFRFFIDIFSQK